MEDRYIKPRDILFCEYTLDKNHLDFEVDTEFGSIPSSIMVQIRKESGKIATDGLTVKKLDGDKKGIIKFGADPDSLQKGDTLIVWAKR